MKRRRQPRRSAAVLVVALICLIVALSITTTMIAASATRRAQLRFETTARQVELLLQAGQGRATARLTADAAFPGEHWTPTIGAAQASVEITTEPSEDGATRVTVAATYPNGDPQAVHRSRVFLFTRANLPNEE